jgi:pimeloyl-ACP methyl ester carboxylesterase
MRSVTVDGRKITFERRGRGPAVVLLHGGLSDHREWRRQMEVLSDRHTVVAWDAPGCGGSDDPPATFRMPDYADALAGFVDALGLQRPHIVGLSWGSSLALELYRRRPDIPRTLVLASAYAGWAGSLPEDVVNERVRDALRDFELPPADVARAWLPTLLTDDAPEEIADEIGTIIASFHRAGAGAMLHSMAEADLRDVLPTITLPTLLLYGERDQRSPLTVAQEMHRRIPGSSLVVLADAGHQSNMESPLAFTDAVLDFIGR